MICLRDKICECIQNHNNFIPHYNELVNIYDCITDYEVESTLYRESIEEIKGLEKAQKLNMPIKLGEIGPLKSIYSGTDYVEIYITKDNTLLAKRTNIR
ncbi:hypothetical protein [Terrisporobacter sp.]